MVMNGRIFGLKNVMQYKKEMKIMKKNTVLAVYCLCLLLGGANIAFAKTVYCSNCSDRFVQALDRITNVQQLKQMADDYGIYIQQLEEQRQMLTENIKQYANMVQNTVSLPQEMLADAKYNLSELAKTTSDIYSIRGDVMAMTEIFDELYPAYDLIGEIVKDPDQSIQEYWATWTKQTDKAIEGVFQLTGYQLNDIAQDGDMLQRHIDSLLQTPEGQMQALQAANNLGAMQFQELREMRTLMATSIQAAAMSAAVDEKEAQVDNEIFRQLTTFDLSDEYKDYL